MEQFLGILAQTDDLMNFSRLKELFNYALWLWLLAPLVFTVSVSDYKLFLIKGVGFAAVSALVFYGLDILVNKTLRHSK
ncbi:MAG: hypothetical protein R2800_11470 [Flavipsychrobacter sp.]